MTPRFRFDRDMLAGHWQFRITDEVRGFFRKRFAEMRSDPSQIEEMMKAVEAEAASSRVEITRGGELISRVSGTEFFRIKLDLAPGDLVSIPFQKPNGSAALRLVQRDVLAVDDPERGELLYDRVRE